MSDKTREIDGMPLRWGSPDGLVHAAEGAKMVGHNPDTFILWAVCGQHDVPANAGVRSRAKVTCDECLAVLAHERQDAALETLANEGQQWGAEGREE